MMLTAVSAAHASTRLTAQSLIIETVIDYDSFVKKCSYCLSLLLLPFKAKRLSKRRYYRLRSLYYDYLSLICLTIFTEFNCKLGVHLVQSSL